MACNEELRESGKSYPRTCADCKLGPCKKLGAKPVQTLSEAQAEIDRLKAEVERLKGVIDEARTDRDRNWALSVTAWNDAIEAAAQHCEKHMKAGGCAGVLIRALRKDNA